MARVTAEQYPYVRAMRFCLSCGGGKHVGLLVCWQCHNELQMVHDGYGPEVEQLIEFANTTSRRNMRDADGESAGPDPSAQRKD